MAAHNGLGHGVARHAGDGRQFRLQVVRDGDHGPIVAQQNNSVYTVDNGAGVVYSVDMNNSNEQTAELIETRNALVAELEKAVNAATHVGALKQSEWYQARKSYLVHLNERIG